MTHEEQLAKRRAKGPSEADLQYRRAYATKAKANYEANRTARIAAMKVYHQKNRAAALEAMKKRNALKPNDPVKCKEASARWRRAHPDEAKAAAQRSRIRRQDVPRTVVTAVQIRARVAFFGDCCAYCGGPYEHLDHTIPLSRGGPHCPANLRPTCASCNLHKAAKPLKVWRSRGSAEQSFGT